MQHTPSDEYQSLYNQPQTEYLIYTTLPGHKTTLNIPNLLTSHFPDSFYLHFCIHFSRDTQQTNTKRIFTLTNIPFTFVQWHDESIFPIFTNQSFLPVD